MSQHLSPKFHKHSATIFNSQTNKQTTQQNVNISSLMQVINTLSAKSKCSSDKKSLRKAIPVLPNCNVGTSKRYNIPMHGIVLRVPQRYDIFECHSQHRPILRKCNITGRLLPIKPDRSATPAELLICTNTITQSIKLLFVTQ